MQWDLVAHVQDVLTLAHLSAQRLVHDFDLIPHYWTLSRKVSVCKSFIERRTDHLKYEGADADEEQDRGREIHLNSQSSIFRQIEKKENVETTEPKYILSGQCNRSRD